MHNLPSPPKPFITHQLECIRCNHKFPISEDNPKRPSSKPTKEWQILPHFHPDEHRRYIYPEMNPYAYQDSFVAESEPGHDKHFLSRADLKEYALIDDRTMSERRGNHANIALFCPRCGADNRNWLHLKTQPKYEIWKYCVVYQFIGFLIVFMLMFLFREVMFVESREQARTGALFVVFLLAGFLPLLLVPSQWKALRDYKYSQHVISSRSLLDSIAPPFITILSLSFIFVIAIPLFLYFVMPITRESIAYNTSSLNLSENIDFMTIWLKLVGLISLVCSLLAWQAVNVVERAYDTHIPQPIYFSISEMTRVGRWEANKALKAREVTRKVQWMDVKRNNIGGLSMLGLLRDRPELEANTVRAQQYHVHTDRWCHIVEANITDIMAPRTVVGDSAELRTVYRTGRNQTHVRISG